MSHLHVLTEHLVQTTREGLVRRALMDLVVQWEETCSRHTQRHTGAGVVSASKGTELRQTGWAGGLFCVRWLEKAS